MIRTLLKPLSFIPALLLMYMIYNFSAQPGDVSAQLSYKVSYKIVETVDQALDANMEYWEIETWVYRIHGLVRKLAHMTEYFALAVAVAFPLYVYGIHGIWLMLLAGLICVGFACGDEYHQSFVEGRGPSKRDVLIDSFGVFWGIILVRIVGWTGRKTIFRPTKKQLAKKEQKAQMKALKKEAKREARNAEKIPSQRIRHDAEFERYDELLYQNQDLSEYLQSDDPDFMSRQHMADSPYEPYTHQSSEQPYPRQPVHRPYTQQVPYSSEQQSTPQRSVSQDTKIYDHTMVSQDTRVYKKPMNQR